MSDGALLTILVVIWAISWPVIKVGVGSVPPIWFAALRLPSRAGRGLVLVSGLLQMAAYSALTALALTRLPAGRASVLAFSTPLWVVPLAVWRGQERVTVRGAAGVAVGLLGILVIAQPSLSRGGARLAVPYLMLVAAAAAWAVSIVFVRGHRFEASPVSLAHWQTLVATVVLVPVALTAKGTPPAFSSSGVAALVYVGTIATAFAYWAVVEVGRRLSASTLSVALLATPSLGLLVSALALHEAVTASLLVGMVLVGAGIRLTITG